MSPLVLMGDMTFSFLPFLTGAFIAFAFFLLAKCIYRVTFHPLATFPGPRWAALTSLYGAFYDLHPNRSYCKQFAALHDTYGPIVRLGPNQLHVRDINTYNQIFKIGSKFEKHPPTYSIPLLEGSYFNMASNKKALARKAMHSPLFSKEAVRRSEHLITDMVAKFLAKLSDYASGTTPVDLTMGFCCITADVAMNYGFQKPFNVLDAEGFQSELIHSAEALLQLFLWSVYFPRFFGGVSRVTAYLPKWFMNRFMKPFALVNWCVDMSREQVVRLQKRPPSERDIRTVFDINFHPNLEKGQFTPTLGEMTADAYGYFNAGTDTTAHTMVVITWALLNNPHTMQRLKAELKVAMPGRDDTVGWARLEKLPYLAAVIKEGLRLAYGAPGQIPRVVPPTGAVFCGQKIPAGTRVASSCYVYHQDPDTFKDPETFRPERWLADAATDIREMENKFLPFSRGSRMCIGINLAYAELYLILAHLYRRFEISNWGTSDTDMQWDDCFVPVTKGHLKVVLRESAD